ncbi:MAG TPA: DNA polymerase III subunit delta, partial [Cytophagaceae bacterium]
YLFSFFSKVLLSHAATDKTEAGLAKLLQQNPYFVKDYLIAIKVFAPNHTVAIIGHLRKADIMSKGIDAVSITEGQILKELVFKILH